MKIYKFFILLFILSLVSCETNDKFSGSPEGVIPIETITATVATQTNYALPGQEIDFTATLPDSFRAIYKDSVSIEATTLNVVGSIRKSNVVILPGQNSATGKIFIGGGTGNLFDSSVNLSLTGIKLNKEIVGKHFLLNSNVINITSGATSIPADDERGLTFKVSWENKNVQNLIQLRTFRDKSVSITFNQASNQGTAKIKIKNVDYLATFDTNLNTTANNFKVLHEAALSSAGVSVTVLNASIILDFLDNTFPNVTITRQAPVVAGTLNGVVFRDAIYNPVGAQSKDFFIYKTQKINSNLSLAPEGALSAFNPGTYIFNIGVANASQLEFNPTEVLKYRVVVKYPDNRVEIYNGVYNNLIPTPQSSGYKPIFKIIKTGYGDTSVYTPTNLNP
jgi:hypothetical protein